MAVDQQIFANNAETTLSANATNGATTLSLTDGSKFPTPAANQYALVTLIKASDGSLEILKYTGKTGADTLTGVTWSQESTGPYNFLAGDAVEMRLTKGTLDGFLQQSEDLSDTDSIATVITNLALAGTDISFTPSGTISAVTVEGAINELESEIYVAVAGLQTQASILDAIATADPVDAGNRIVYFTGINSAALTDLSAFGRTLVDDTSASAARTTLELNAGETGDIWVEKAGDTMSGALDMGSQNITSVANITADNFIGSNANGPSILGDEVASATNPVVIIDKTDETTGFGGDVASGEIYAIIGGVQTHDLAYSGVGGGTYAVYSNIADSTSITPRLHLQRNSTDTVSDGQGLGGILFAGSDDALTDGLTYARIAARVLDASTGTIDGALEFRTVAANTLYDIFQFYRENAWFVSSPDDATAGPFFKFLRGRALNTTNIPFSSATASAGQDADVLGEIDFLGFNDNATPAQKKYAGIRSEIVDASDTTEDGKLVLSVLSAGSEIDPITIDGAAGISMLTTDITSLTINSAYTLPTADGTADYVLSTNGAGTVSWVAQSGGSGGGGSGTSGVWEYISTGSMGTGANVFIELPAGYDAWRVTLVGVRPDTDGTDAHITFSTDGSTEDTTGYHYVSETHRSGGTACIDNESTTATSIPLSETVGMSTAAGQDFNSVMYFYGFQDNTEYAMVVHDSTWYDETATGGHSRTHVAGRQGTQSVFTHVCLTAGGNNWEAGTYFVEGLKAPTATPSATGSWEVIQTQTASGSTSLDFDLPSGYQRYMFVCSEIVLATDNITFQMRVSNDGGSTFQASASDYQWNVSNHDAAAVSTDDETGFTTAIDLTSQGFTAQIGNAAGEFSAWTVYVDGALNSSLYTHISWDGLYTDNNGDGRHSWGGAMYTTAETVNAIRFLAESGNITSGRITLLGFQPTASTQSLIVDEDPVATTSGTAVELSTTIPSWAKRIVVTFDGVSTDGTDEWLIQLGDATTGGYVTSGYLGCAGVFLTASQATTNHTAGFGIRNTAAAAVTYGSVTINLHDAANFEYCCQGQLARSDTNASLTTAGKAVLSGLCDRIRVTTTGGTNAYDAGSIAVHYE